MLPKTESAEDIASVHVRIGHDIAVVALVETVAELRHLPQILEAPNLTMIAFGSIDLALDLGCAHDQQALLAARSEIVWRSQAANRAAPLDGVTVNLDVQDAFETNARHSSALDPVDQFDDLHLAGENREQRTLPPVLMHGVFPGTEVDVGRRRREQLEFRARERKTEELPLRRQSSKWFAMPPLGSALLLVAAPNMYQRNHGAHIGA